MQESARRRAARARPIEYSVRDLTTGEMRCIAPSNTYDTGITRDILSAERGASAATVDASWLACLQGRSECRVYLSSATSRCSAPIRQDLAPAPPRILRWRHQHRRHRCRRERRKHADLGRVCADQRAAARRAVPANMSAPRAMSVLSCGGGANVLYGRLGAHCRPATAVAARLTRVQCCAGSLRHSSYCPATWR